MTANCSPSWTSLKINTYIFLLNFSSLYPKANLYLSQCSSFSKKKTTTTTTKNKICGFRRFHGLLIHNLVTPKNMEKSSQILETNHQDSNCAEVFIQAVRIDTRFIWLKKQPSSVLNCCELKRNTIFSG